MRSAQLEREDFVLNGEAAWLSLILVTTDKENASGRHCPPLWASKLPGQRLYLQAAQEEGCRFEEETAMTGKRPLGNQSAGKGRA